MSSPIPPIWLQRAEACFRAGPVSDGSDLQLVSPLPGVALLRQSVATTLEATVYEPVLCLILQGQKQITFEHRTSRLCPGDCLLVTHDLPLVSCVVEVPYLALILTLDVDILRSLHNELGESPGAPSGARGLQIHAADPALLEAAGRCLALSGSPMDAKVLGPMISREIHYRLLTAPVGGMLRGLVRYDGHAWLVSRAITLIRRDFRSPIRVAELAGAVGMSASSFHRHFKAVTSLTPIQYQKELRLMEARRLLTSGGPTVAETAFGVGYESASQFSREYTRRFGRSPKGERATG